MTRPQAVIAGALSGLAALIAGAVLIVAGGPNCTEASPATPVVRAPSFTGDHPGLPGPSAANPSRR